MSMILIIAVNLLTGYALSSVVSLKFERVPEQCV